MAIWRNAELKIAKTVSRRRTRRISIIFSHHVRVRRTLSTSVPASADVCMSAGQRARDLRLG